MTLTYDLSRSNRSPQSSGDAAALARERNCNVSTNVHPVYSIAVRIDGFFKNVDPLRWRYLRRD